MGERESNEIECTCSTGNVVGGLVSSRSIGLNFVSGHTKSVKPTLILLLIITIAFQCAKYSVSAGWP